MEIYLYFFIEDILVGYCLFYCFWVSVFSISGDIKDMIMVISFFDIG